MYVCMYVCCMYTDIFNPSSLVCLALYISVMFYYYYYWKLHALGMCEYIVYVYVCMCSNVCTYVCMYVYVWYVRVLLAPNYPCVLQMWENYFLTVMIATIYTFRLFILVFRHGITHERIALATVERERERQREKERDKLFGFDCQEPPIYTHKQTHTHTQKHKDRTPLLASHHSSSLSISFKQFNDSHASIPSDRFWFIHHRHYIFTRVLSAWFTAITLLFFFVPFISILTESVIREPNGVLCSTKSYDITIHCIQMLVVVVFLAFAHKLRLVVEGMHSLFTH